MDFWAENKYAYARGNKPIKNLTIDRLVWYGEIASSGDGVSFKIDQTEIKLNLLGEYNAANAMTAVCLGLSQGIEPAEIKTGLAKVKSIPGRMELIRNEQSSFTVVIDYAFEPEALKKIYETILKLDHHKITKILTTTTQK